MLTQQIVHEYSQQHDLQQPEVAKKKNFHQVTDEWINKIWCTQHGVFYKNKKK